MPKQDCFFRLIFRYFLSGVVAVLPLVVTVALVLWLTGFFMTWLGPETTVGKLLSAIGLKFVPGAGIPYLFGWLAVLGALLVLGFFVDAVTRKMAVRWFDAAVKKIPLVGTIYGTTRQFTDLMDKGGGEKMKSMCPVYCRFGSAAGGVLILALMPTEQEYVVAGNPYRVVIVPTAPVPFGGGMFFIPSADVFPADMSIDAFMSFYVSMGVANTIKGGEENGTVKEMKEENKGE